MAPHSSTLAWRIPWTEEPGKLWSMGLLRVGLDWATSVSLFTFHFHALEKEMATHSSVLAWRIPGTGEPGGLRSMRSHRVGHNWSDLAAAVIPWTADLNSETLKNWTTLKITEINKCLKYCFEYGSAFWTQEKAIYNRTKPRFLTTNMTPPKIETLISVHKLGIFLNAW